VTTEDSDAEDDRLLARGDLGALLARHFDDLVAHARVRVGAARADDVVQAALLRTLRELRAGRRWPIPFRAVVHQHLRWACADAFGETATATLPEDWDVPDPVGEDAYLAVEERIALGALLDALPPGDRRVMRLRYLDGWEIEAIAGELGMTRNAVDQALWRGRRAIREEWAGG
jgi:RNA polymerase sigma factor (sigma-70 family)